MKRAREEEENHASLDPFDILFALVDGGQGGVASLILYHVPLHYLREMCTRSKKLAKIYKDYSLYQRITSQDQCEALTTCPLQREARRFVRGRIRMVVCDSTRDTFFVLTHEHNTVYQMSFGRRRIGYQTAIPSDSPVDEISSHGSYALFRLRNGRVILRKEDRLGYNTYIRDCNIEDAKRIAVFDGDGYVIDGAGILWVSVLPYERTSRSLRWDREYCGGVSRVRTLSVAQGRFAALLEAGEVFLRGVVHGPGEGAERVRANIGENRIVSPHEEDPIVDVALSRANTIILTASGLVYGWGENTHGELGTGHTHPVEGVLTQMILPNGGDPIGSIHTNWYGTYAINKTRTAVYACGALSAEPQPLVLDEDEANDWVLVPNPTPVCVMECSSVLSFSLGITYIAANRLYAPYALVIASTKHFAKRNQQTSGR